MKKLVVTLLISVLILIALSGCISEEEETEQITTISENLDPIPVISVSGTINPKPDYIDQDTVDAFAYEGDTITFDASGSYDPDGQIVSYEWILDDTDTIATGSIATCAYAIDDVFSVDFSHPVEIVLMITDDNDSVIPLTYILGVVPKNYVFYFDSATLKFEKSNAGDDKVRATLGRFRPIEELNYALNKPVAIQKCTWNATLYLEKPIFAFVKYVSLTLHNSSGEKIAEAELSFKMFDFWREKTISLNGVIRGGGDFESVKLSISGFSFRESISILYGGEAASFICFDFTS